MMHVPAVHIKEETLHGKVMQKWMYENDKLFEAWLDSWTCWLVVNAKTLPRAVNMDRGRVLLLMTDHQA